jgi:NDP-sugar pyrophosphorylase family protein
MEANKISTVLNKKMKLIILAAGKGTRFYPLTKEIPKGLIKLGDKTLLDHVIKPYLNHVSDIIFVINDELGFKIKEYFGENYKNHDVSYIIQTADHKRGTMSALKLCRNIIDEGLFCVSNCDDLLIEEDIKKAVECAVPGIGITHTIMPYNYLGIETSNVTSNQDDNVIENNFATCFKRHNKEDGEKVLDYFANGFYVLSREIFDFSEVETRDGEVGLPHTLFANLSNYPLRAFPFQKWQSVNGPENMEAAEKFISEL